LGNWEIEVHFCGMKNDLPVIIAAGGLVTNEHGELLMIFRRGRWDLPKGKLDEGETIEQCALREVAEETGLSKLKAGALAGITHHTYFDTYSNTDVVKETHWYRMSASSQQPLIPQTEEDITDIRWVKGKELEECLENSYENIVEIVGKLIG